MGFLVFSDRIYIKSKKIKLNFQSKDAWFIKVSQLVPELPAKQWVNYS